MPVCTVCVPGTYKGQKWSSDSLKLKLEVVTRASRRAASVLNY